MRARLGRILGLSYLLVSLQFLNVSCSSSGSGDAQSEEVAANEEGGDEASSNEANGNEGNVAESGAAANNAESGDQAANTGENNALANDGQANAGLGNEAQPNNGLNAVAENGGAGQAGGEEDLQQIIEEMNTANGAQAASQPLSGNAAGDVAETSNSLTEAASTGNQAVSAPVVADTTSTSASAGTPAGPGLPEMGSKMSYIVQKGDTLAKISQRVYGDGSKWTEIANFTGLANPRLIYPGDVVYYQLTEQSMKFSSTYESVKRSEIQIQQGDTLATISGRVFGNSSLWKLIWRQNDRIDNPDRLTAGT
ncbi:MAG: LysM peptidoglycan-binding domain-containing protein, partial [Proteobacteria bacterium]|nr:LysM peptidoglycan-binding domain-containing protein [Pseudomonadota bacterium]